MLAITIRNSARKHGISDDHIRHALHNHITQIIGSNDLPIVIGPDPAGNLIEVGFVVDDEIIVVIHAMRARNSIQRNL